MVDVVRIAVVVPIAGSLCVAFAVTPSPLPWGWLPYGILLVWGVNLLDLLVQAIRAGFAILDVQGRYSDPARPRLPKFIIHRA